MPPTRPITSWRRSITVTCRTSGLATIGCKIIPLTVDQIISDERRIRL